MSLTPTTNEVPIHKGHGWRLALVALAVAVPLVIDPAGDLSFSVPKNAVLLVGTALASFLWASSRLFHRCVLSDGNANTEFHADRTLMTLALLFWLWSIIAPLGNVANVLLHASAAAHLSAGVVIFALVVLAQGSQRWLLAALAITGLFVSAYAIMQAWGVEPLSLLIPKITPMAGRWRTYTTMGNPNWTAEYIAVTAPLAVAWLQTRNATSWDIGQYHRRSPTELLPLLVWITSAAAILLTGTRLSFLALLAAGFYWWWWTPGFRRTSFRIRLASSLVGASLLLLLVIPYVTELPERILDKESLAGRVVLYETSLHLMADAPWTGRGLEHFAVSAPAGLRKTVANLSSNWLPWLPHSLPTHADNDFLQAAVEAGLPAMILLFGLWLRGFALIHTRVRGKANPAQQGDLSAAGIGASLVAFLVLALGSHPLGSPATFLVFWVLLGSSAASTTPLKSARLRARPGSVLSALAAVVAAVLLLFVTANWQLDVFTANRYAAQGYYEREQGHYADAEGLFRQAVTYNPRQSYNFRALAALLQRRGDVTGALTMLDQATGLEPNYEDWLLRATLLMQGEEASQARLVLLEAVRTIPDFLRAWLALGDLYCEEGEWNAAISAYRRVLVSTQRSALATETKAQAAAGLARVMENLTTGKMQGDDPPFP